MMSKLKKWLRVVEAATWSTATIDGLPDSSFLYIEPGGKKDDDGKTEPRSLRHFPYKDADGKIDEAHLDDALSRIPQSGLPDDVKEKVQAKAERIKQNLAKGVEKADEPDPAALTQAVVAAYHDALTEHSLDVPDSGFTVSQLADSDGDADGDGSSLWTVYDRYASWYVLADASGAKVIAFYAYPYGGWCDEACLFCSEAIATAVEKTEGPVPTERAARDSWLVKLLSIEPEADPAAYRVVKADAAQRYTLGVAYPIDELDSHGDFTDAVELEKAAWSFMRDVVAKGESGVGTDHAEGTDDSAQVVESYIWRGPDWVDDDGETVAKAGDWMVGAVWDEMAWPRVEKGELTGWSIQGLAHIDDEATPPEA